MAIFALYKYFLVWHFSSFNDFFPLFFESLFLTVAQGFIVYIVGYQSLFQININVAIVKFRNVTLIRLYSHFPLFCAVIVILIT